MSSLTTKINALNYCGKSGMPACSGSNVAAGIYSAIQQFSTVSSTNTIKNIIIITDGVPNASSGQDLYQGGRDLSHAHFEHAHLHHACTDANLLTMAQDQASDAAMRPGSTFPPSTIPADTAASQQASYAASLATLRRGTGVSLVAPTAATITTVLGGFCATMPSAVTYVH